MLTSICISAVAQNAVAVAHLYEHMALVSDSCAFSWSHWNGDVKDPERLLVRAGEHLVSEPPAEARAALCCLSCCCQLLFT